MIRCKGCGVDIIQPKRPQGGGTTKIWCSSKCASREWQRNNKDRSKEIKLKYSSKPENRRKKQDRSKLWRRNQPEYKETQRFKKHNITKEDYYLSLARQHNKCLGCYREFSDNVRPCIDHNHTTNKFRGLLCDACNTSLGQVKEDIGTLYRLAAYLSYDNSKLGCYVVGSLRNPVVPVVGDSLRALDFDVYDHWASSGEFADDAWRDYEKGRGKNYKEALYGRSAKNVFYFDKAYLDLSDIAVLVMPGGKSAFMELGYLIGSGKPTYILLDGDPDRFDVMPQFVNQVFYSTEEMVDTFKKLYCKNDIKRTNT